MTTPPSDPLGDDEPPRIVLPTPGGKRKKPKPKAEEPAPEPIPEPTLSVSDILGGFRFEGGDLPVMVSAAAPLLNLAHALRSSNSRAAIGDLRREVVEAVRTYESDLGRAGILPDQARAGHYVVCATLDDVIRNTEWGAEWAVEGLVSTFHHDVEGGDKVFALLSHFQKTPGANRDLLLLIYLCLSLGFEGRSRVSPRGATELAQVRESLFRTLRTQFDITERDLSPSWRGEDASHKVIKRGMLFWLITGLTALLLVGVFAGLNYLLSQSVQGTLAKLETLPPNNTPSLVIPEPAVAFVAPLRPEVRPDREEPEVVELDPEISTIPPIETFLAFLQPEEEAGLVRLYREGDVVLVRIANAGAFGSGDAQIAPDFVDIFDRIGTALVAENFEVLVLGHTDSRPVNSSAFRTNERLSTARASAVRDIFAGYIDIERVQIEGMADSLPIADESTPSGQEANRRTDIVVFEPGNIVPDSLLSVGAFPTTDPETEVSE